MSYRFDTGAASAPELRQVVPGGDSMAYVRYLIIVTGALLCFGLTMLYSTSYGTSGAKYFQSQIVWAVIGGMIGGGCFVIGYRKVSNAAPYLILGVFLLLLIACFCFPAINGAHRWIRIRLPGLRLSLQPSELGKVALALYLAKYCAENIRTLNTFSWNCGIFKPALATALVAGGILMGQDYGTTVLTATMAVAMLLAGGLALRYILIPMGLAGMMAFYIWKFSPVRLARVTSFLAPELYQKTIGYQLWNSLLALGSGGLTGIGFMESRLKAKYLPEAHTDFILAIVGEELGLTGMVAVILGYLTFAFLGLKISLNSTSRQGMLLGFGLTTVLTFQAIINIGVISGLFPTKGMPAPFISYGGTNLVVSLVALGLLLSIGCDTARPGYDREIREKLKTFIGCFMPGMKEKL